MRRFLASLALLAALSASPAARADRQFGGCSEEIHTCFGFSASLHLVEVNLSARKIGGGFVPGAGYGATFAPDKWYAAGLAAYLSTSVGGGKPSNVTPSLVASFANYLRVGVGLSVAEQGSTWGTEWLLLLGVGSDFGGSPNYFKESLRDPDNS